MADISPVAPLAFNPMTAQHDVQAVFRDDLATILWIAIKRRHIVSQHFNRACLHRAEEIRKVLAAGVELDARRLLYILSSSIPDGILGTAELEFAEALLPFVKGEQSIEYRVRVTAGKK